MSACIGGRRALAHEQHNLGASQLKIRQMSRPPRQRDPAFEVEGSIDLHRVAEWKGRRMCELGHEQAHGLLAQTSSASPSVSVLEQPHPDSPVWADTVAKLICQSPANNFSEHD
jgi:hypothetical protein